MVYSINPDFRQYNYNTINRVKTDSVGKKGTAGTTQTLAFTSNPVNYVPLNPVMNVSPLRTRLEGKEEKNKYNTLLKNLDKDTKKTLKLMLKQGILLNANSNDNSSVLDNLYKIATTPRAAGLSNTGILKDTINTLFSPYNITQQFGDLPKGISEQVRDIYMEQKTMRKTNLLDRKIAELDVNVDHSGTCVASSIEFNLAKQMPAEFARFAAGISSSDMSVQKQIKLSNLADNTLDAVWLLNAFEIPFEMKDFDKATLTFTPDKNAIIRAQIQTLYKDPYERSALDVLMQSTFMQVGSQQSYDSLSDKRAGKFNQNDKGLIEFEKTFTESVVEDKNKISVTYQTVDENAKLIGYETDLATMKKQITTSLDRGENVIIGYTQVDDNNYIINGHEITIIGYKKAPQTNPNAPEKLIFICNDTDDNQFEPIEYDEDYLLPKIHHAALPHDVVENDVQMTENWVEGLNTYKDMKKKAE
ncbi:TPA: hypothetical protein IAC10_03650 [Candidatus Scatousia excrementigallinarum]|uniref:Uncharacterized protein n=1 Tax=Candidatus Scatousia excrementigallinarum TaxID=2840935 RepID=A0A9D1EXH6_9BACT|nr:hypothetical protein [Candidatus Scatousia excrementigallinarum]